MGGYEVKVEIDRSQTSTFTNYDTIRGLVTLVVTKSVSLSYIQVKLEGVSRTLILVPIHKNGKVEHKNIQDVHKLLYDVSIVFPPENIRQVSSAKDYTLGPGNHTYPFEFKIPLNNSCVKLSGITNKVQVNKNLDVFINNGNFNSRVIRNSASSRLSKYSNGDSTGYAYENADYHITTPLPPSLNDNRSNASIEYFVKVTAKRSSFFKASMRGFDPFVFLPLDLDVQKQLQGGEYREVFARKEVVFADRIPEIVGVPVAGKGKKGGGMRMTKALPKLPQTQKKQGFLSRLFDSGASEPPTSERPLQSKSSDYYAEIEATEVPFAFEVRFRHPAFLVPDKTPSFKLYLVSPHNPTRYSLARYGRPDESNGLGVVYMQGLVVSLRCTTLTSVLQTEGLGSDKYHHACHENVINICNNSFQDLKLDLKNCRPANNSSLTSASDFSGETYELEIPRKYFSNCVVPEYLAPSFQTCNITRKYTLTIEGSFSSEKVGEAKNSRDVSKYVKTVELQCTDIKVLSGLSMTSELHSSSKTSLGEIPPPKLQNYNSHHTDHKEQIPEAPAYERPSGPPPGASAASTHAADLAQSPPRPAGPESSSSYVSSLDAPQQLPTYDDAVLESSYQDNSEHHRARRRYQQHE